MALNMRQDEKTDTAAHNEADFWCNPNTSTIKEYCIVLPLSVEEYEKGHNYGILESIKEIKDCHGSFKWIKNKQVKTDRGLAQYTERIIPLIPDKDRSRWCARYFGSKGMLDITEKSYDTYPTCRTRYYNQYMNENFHIIVESQHKDGAEKNDNIFNLTEEELAKRQIVNIDIVNDKVQPNSQCVDIPDPSTYTSKTGRGPFQGPCWFSKEEKVMCVYKLYRVEFKWRFIQKCAEKAIFDATQKTLFNLNRKIVCSMDTWLNMKKADIEELQEKTQKDTETKNC